MINKLFLIISLSLFSVFTSVSAAVIITPAFQQTSLLTLPWSAVLVSAFAGGPYANLGFNFNANNTVSINALGAFSSVAFPLSTTKWAGIWQTNTQTLLGSVQITPSSPYSLNNFQYALIPTITLVSGTNYTVGLVEQSTDRSTPMGMTGYVSGPQGLPGKRNSGSASNALVFPGTNYNNGNATASVNAAFIALPEPSTYLMMGGFLAFGLLVLHNRRKIAV